MFEEHVQHVKSQSPLLGVVLCCTSVAPEERVNLANIAKQMGAVHKLDLTSDVTHLIVGNTDTPKYKYVAKERPDVKAVVAEWVEAVRDSWMQGGDTDVAALEEEYRVPTFFGLRICLTGFEDITQRQAIMQAVNENGAIYHGDLSKSVTHLVAAVAQGKKYEFARQWGVTVVTLQWITDSLRRRMALEGAYYDPTLPAERQGQGAFKEFLPEHVQLEKRARDEEAAQKAVELGRKKLRRTASAKLGSQNLQLWQNITAGSDHAQRDTNNEWTDPDTLTNPAQPSERDLTDGPNGHSINEKSGTLVSSVVNRDNRLTTRTLPKQGIFQGRLIYIHCFDATKTAVLIDHLRANGADVYTSETNLSSVPEDKIAEGIVLVPHDLPIERLTNIPSAVCAMTKATDWWAERCLHHRCYISPSSSVLCQPFRAIGIKEFQNLRICSTAFSGIELLQLSKVVKLMGATYDEFLKSSASTLISNTKTPNTNKLRFAAEHGIPVVTPEWLWRCIKTTSKVPFGSFLVHDHNLKEMRAVAGGVGGNAAGPNFAETRMPSSAKKVDRSLTTKSHLNEATSVRERSISGEQSSPAPSENENSPAVDSVANQPHPSVDNINKQEPQTSGSLLLYESKRMSADAQSLQKEPNPRKDRSYNRLDKANQVMNTNGSMPSKNVENAISPPADADNVQDLNASIAELLALKKTHEKHPNSKTGDNNTTGDTSKKPLPTSKNIKERRRRGLLGRATSNISNPSNTSRAGSDETGRTPGAAGAIVPAPNSPDSSPGHDTTNSFSAAAAAAAAAGNAMLFPDTHGADAPSQALLYEDPEVQKQREAVIRKIGGRVEPESERSRTVQGIGVVKDMAADIEGIDGAGDAVGLRVKRRSRQAERDFRDLR